MMPRVTNFRLVVVEVVLKSLVYLKNLPVTVNSSVDAWNMQA